MSKPSDERRTPRWFFEACDRLWGPFDLDAAAAKWNRQVERYCTDVLEHPPRAKRVWLNPPYSRGQLDAFLALARRCVLEGRWQRCVCLIPVDPSAGWWQRQIETPAERGALSAAWLYDCFPAPFAHAHQRRCPALTSTVIYVPTRLRFDEPGGFGHRDTGAKQPSAVVVFERTVRTSARQRVGRVANPSSLIVRSAL